MIAMQYRIVLPADYDMGIIRRRIAERGHLTDRFPHLAFKAYLFSDRSAATGQGRENLYAPFYLWHHTEGMNAFLGGAGFAGVVESFGRPIVQTWSVWRAETAADLSSATHATRELMPVSARTTLGDLRDAEQVRLQTDLDRGALAAVSAYDPTQWNVLRFRLWRGAVERPDGDNVDVYQVGHISQPSSNH
ncbi:DUF4865 family protein [Dyella psychrodurans]|uniref:DUF4865 family protein n=1 Tax=Dyella psychrodurans TaxID=1927960 RepID=A0A370X6G0_9GAMM|nr:DUF4865 family protein [Dyella psychrodurans]RDS84013.1 DUF4865 family protein [Dyella psychrodurans]